MEGGQGFVPRQSSTKPSVSLSNLRIINGGGGGVEVYVDAKILNCDGMTLSLTANFGEKEGDGYKYLRDDDGLCSKGGFIAIRREIFIPGGQAYVNGLEFFIPRDQLEEGIDGVGKHDLMVNVSSSGGLGPGRLKDFTYWTR